MTTLTPGSSAAQRAVALFAARYDKVVRRVDRIFVFLLCAQWVGAVLVAAFYLPPAFEDDLSGRHPHVLLALFLGGAINAVPLYLARRRPGAFVTRLTLAVAQMFWSALLIHMSGGRIETHFHVFGSLAFLAFYRDVWVLIPATIVVALDHFVRGTLWPESVYGLADAEWWRTVEHVAWVLFIDIFLIRNCINSRSELESLCDRQAQLEASEGELRELSAHLEERVDGRTKALRRTVDELEEAKAEVEAGRRELFQFLENMPHGVSVMDHQGNLVFYNDEMERIIGPPSTELVAPSDLNARYGAYVAGTETPYPDELNPVVCALQGRHAHVEDVEFVSPAGRVRVAAWSAPVRDGDGNTKYALNVVEDITARVKLQTELLHAQKLESIGQLAAGVAHEINTPLQYVGDNAHFLSKAFDNLLAAAAAYERIAREAAGPDVDAVDARLSEAGRANKVDFLRRKVPRALQASLEGVQAVSEIVAAMKSFSHIDDRQKVATQLNEVVRNTVTVARNEWKYVAEVELELDDELPDVPGLPSELNQVLLNLLINAAHAVAAAVPADHSEKGRIGIRTRREGDEVVVEVEDTGVGIPASLRERVFDPFFTTKEVGKGSGQGLALARSVIVDKHGGSIALESQEGVGTTFTVRLPVG